MWKASCLALLLACGDDGKQAQDAPRPIDAAIDAVPDAPFACRSAADCTSAAPDCCWYCGPGGACNPGPSCLAAGSNFCRHALCDPMATTPCMKPFNGGPGACVMVALSMNDMRMVWACK
jgi:hypothetical protein